MGRPLIRTLAAGSIAVLLNFAFATSSQAIGLALMYEDAKLSDPQYAAAKADWDSVQTLIPQARGQLLPQISGSYSSIKNDTNFEQRFANNKTQQKEYEFIARNASINLTQGLLRPQAWFAYSQANAQVRQADGQLRYAGFDLILRLSLAYFETLLAEDNVILAAEQKTAIGEQLKQAKRYFEAGLGTITDINESQARYDTVVAQELAAQNNLEIKVRSIEQLVGKVYRKLDRLGDRLQLEQPEPASVDTWLDFAIANNPLLKAREAALEVSEHEVYKNMAAHLPTVDLVASRSRSTDPSFTMLDSTAWNNAIGIQVSVPIFASGTTQARSNQASAIREKTRYEMENTKRSIILSTRQEFLNVMNGVAQVKALEQAVKSNEIALYSAKKGQEAGLRTSFDVLNAQQLLFSAKRDLAQARYGYVMARLKLRSAAGLLGNEDVQLVQLWLNAN